MGLVSLSKAPESSLGSLSLGRGRTLLEDAICKPGLERPPNTEPTSSRSWASGLPTEMRVCCVSHAVCGVMFRHMTLERPPTL